MKNFSVFVSLNKDESENLEKSSQNFMVYGLLIYCPITRDPNDSSHLSVRGSVTRVSEPSAEHVEP